MKQATRAAHSCHTFEPRVSQIEAARVLLGTKTYRAEHSNGPLEPRVSQIMPASVLLGDQVECAPRLVRFVSTTSSQEKKICMRRKFMVSLYISSLAWAHLRTFFDDACQLHFWKTDSGKKLKQSSGCSRKFMEALSNLGPSGFDIPP